MNLCTARALTIVEIYEDWILSLDALQLREQPCRTICLAKASTRVVDVELRNRWARDDGTILVSEQGSGDKIVASLEFR
jgi:agmatine/peptidylarginine deiminase